MKPEGPTRVLIEMLLGEDEITHVSDQYVAAKVEDDVGLETNYYLDADSEGQWQPLDRPGAVDPDTRRKLEQLLAQHPEAAAVAQSLRGPQQQMQGSEFDKMFGPQATYHSTTDPHAVESIIMTGLRAGSSVSSSRGQGISGPIVFVYGSQDRTGQVPYRPGDAYAAQRYGKPDAILLDADEFLEVRPLDQVLQDYEALEQAVQDVGISKDEYTNLRVLATSNVVGDRDERRRAKQVMRALLDKAGVKVDYRRLDWELETWTERDPDKQYPTQTDIVLASARKHGIPIYRLEYDEKLDSMRPGKMIAAPR